MKILSPAGNFEALKSAVFCGADEVYLGVNNFNARNNIDGFTLSTLSEAVDFCHIYNVKVNLAINILFSNEELFSALSTISTAYEMGVDAFIIQDLALAYLVKKHLPNAVIHASTQMAVHNLEGVKALIPYGFSRVVLARETPIEEIIRIKQNTDIEIEYFSHGALCVSFSGNCYLSSYLNNASGNRGKCKQLCRLPYSLFKGKTMLKKGYLLSAKDFDMTSKLIELKNAGVDVLKIEGRARRPFYVATSTMQYKKALSGKKIDREKLNLAFNRGFTCGYFEGNESIISSVSSHTGIYIGKITNIEQKRSFNQVFFTSNRPLYPRSTFKTFNNGIEREVITAFDLKKANQNEYVLTTTTALKKGDDIHLIIDSKLEEETLSITKKVDFPVALTLKEGQPITANFIVNNKPSTIFGDILLKAKSSPLTEEELKENFNKSEYFNIQLSAKISSPLFLAKKQLNEFRRNVLDSIRNQIISKYKKSVSPIDEKEINNQIERCKNSVRSQPLQDFIIVDDLKNIESIKEKHIIYSPEEYTEENIKKAKSLCEKANKLMYLDLPNFALKDDIIALNSIIDKLKLPFVCNNYYSLTFEGEKIIGGGLNVYNDLTAHLLNAPYLTSEKPSPSKISFPYMTLRHCPYKNHLKVSCDNCPHSNDYYLSMPNGKKLKIKRKKLSSCTFYLTD